MRRIIKNIATRWDISILVVCMSAYIVTFSTLSILRHNAFASNFDLANMDQTVWNSSQGRMFQLSGPDETISRFAIHADLILVLLAPFYWVWEDVRMLLIIQSIALGLGAIPVYLLALKILKERLLALGIVIAYLLNPGMQWTNIYDFHGIALAIPCILTATYAGFMKKWKTYWVFIFLTLITKEQISLFIMMLGFFIFFRHKTVGIITSIIGVSWFLIMVFLIMPKYSTNNAHWALVWFDIKPSYQTHQYIDHFTHLDSLKARFINQQTIHNYYLLLLKPFGFLPLIGFPMLLIVLPELGINLFSNQTQMQSIFFHYDSGIVPGLILATILAFYILQKITELTIIRKYKNVLLFASLLWLLAWSIRFNYNYSPLPTTPSCWCWSYQVTDADREFEKVLRTIPQEASITASGNVRPHLTHRINAYTLPNQYTSADYVAILTQQRIVGDHRSIDTHFVEELRASPKHELINNIEQFYLFKKIQ